MAEHNGVVTTPANTMQKHDAIMGKTSASPLRQWPIGRASTSADVSNPSRQRRSSTFSDSVDDARQSIKSSTDDLLLPRLRSGGLPSQREPSHWHSTPLALALLPAIGGILFHDGSAIVTDITLLGLAAVFLNWSVRLPWYVGTRCPLIPSFLSNHAVGSGTIQLGQYTARSPSLDHPTMNRQKTPSLKRKRKKNRTSKRRNHIQPRTALLASLVPLRKPKNTLVLQPSYVCTSSLLYLHASYPPY